MRRPRRYGPLLSPHGQLLLGCAIAVVAMAAVLAVVITPSL